MAKSRQVAKICNVILNENISEPQQLLSLFEAASHPQLRQIFKSAGLNASSETMKVAIYNENQRRKMIKKASKTNKSRGRATEDKRSFLLANLAASADSPEQEISYRPSKSAKIRSMGLSKTTGYRYLSIAKKQRMETRNGTINVPWSSVEKRKGYSKVSPELRKKLFEWINNHPHIVNSPISNDTLLVPDPEQPGNRVKISKLLLQISI
jgi:hypothetical protein